MKHYQYIIIGGGMTGSAAVMGIRENDPDGTIAMFSDEAYEPYNRPPLTKGLWDGKDIKDIVRPMAPHNVVLFLNTSVRKISPDEKFIETETGDQFNYQKLLLATGGDPIHLPSTPEGVIYYRTRADYHQLQDLTQSKNHFCVIGAGFIGSEITAALIKKGKKVTMIFPERGISGLLFPDDLANYLNDYYREKGVEVLNGFLVESISKNGDQYQVRYKPTDSDEFSQDGYDAVIIGVGIKPNTTLAQETGMDTDDGILVNEFLQTTMPDIFAAGDVANFKHFGLDKRTRVEHEDNANTMGRLAGLNMSGEMEKYDHFPFFYSDLFDLGYEAVGELNKDFEIHSEWIEPYHKGTIFYLKDGKIRGLIFWNNWGKVEQGCQLIQEGKSYQKSDLQTLFTSD